MSVFLLVLAMLFGPALPAFGQASCAQFAALAEDALPAPVGTLGLVASMISSAAEATTTRPLSVAFAARATRAALGEAMKAGQTCPTQKERLADPGGWRCLLHGGKKSASTLDVDMTRGWLTYLNPQRRFDPAGPDLALSAPQGIAAAVGVLRGLGVPDGEIDLDRTRTRRLAMAAAPTDGSAPAAVRRIELMAVVRRQIGGFPVIGSEGKVVLDVQGRPARVHLVWPDFSRLPGVEATATLSRLQVIARIVEALGSFASCEAFARLHVQVGWVDARRATADDQVVLPDASDEDGGTESSGRFVPAIRVYAVPPETAEDAGQIADFVHALDVPLVGGGEAET